MEWKIRNHLQDTGKTREDLSIAYTPGVAAPCRIIAEIKKKLILIP